ncbi:hypothetical protein GCM10022237_12780 [Nocardioides ginsengisoli]
MPVSGTTVSGQLAAARVLARFAARDAEGAYRLAPHLEGKAGGF